MTHLFVSPFTASEPQRNRRLLLTLPAACALPTWLTACGGGADLSYDTEQALYFVGEAITPNKPQPAPPNPPPPGHTAPRFTVFPPLPAGLTLNAQTGVISGTPTKLKRQGTHLVVATNNKGFADTQVRITVTGRGSWSPVAPVPGARAFASISPLPGGKFLVAGGQRNEGATASAQIYDPSTATWSAAASMLEARAFHVAVTLRDGRVLVVAGRNVNADVGGSELYDPVANTWTAAGQTNETRAFCTAHLLASGKVLVVGGITLSSGNENFHDTAELYDPAEGVWTPLLTRLSTPRARHAAALLPDGKTLLVAGGDGVGTAELYKVNGSATKVIPYGVEGNSYKAVKLDDGSVLVTTDGSEQSRRYHPTTSTWTTSTAVHGRRSFYTLTLLADGRVLMDGGGLPSSAAEIYNPDVNQWTTATPMDVRRFGAAAALLGDGSVLLVGGKSGDASVDASERYLP
ncbi:putative Ig domain-containing protein [Hydrogenophaga sp. BPS33]|uniref:putative Ig domain-containing protein n=1 Tax=Hydrogenophaga sp. BPS33 TaxID=2651974 RepID=UPI00135690B0|nr:putative Ig domain-containing protein [Hydrogenophaga sp. BPS33]